MVKDGFEDEIHLWRRKNDIQLVKILVLLLHSPSSRHLNKVGAWERFDIHNECKIAV
jgi:hypothetical protein